MIINPRRVTALPPAERVDGGAVNAANLSLELGYRQEGSWHALEQRPAGPVGEPVTFSLADNPYSLVTDTPLVIGVRAVEGRPDLVTDEFPNGVDLFSTWAEGGTIIYANPPQPPAAVEVTG